MDRHGLALLAGLGVGEVCLDQLVVHGDLGVGGGGAAHPAVGRVQGCIPEAQRAPQVVTLLRHHVQSALKKE